MANPEYDNYKSPMTLAEIRDEADRTNKLIPAGAEKVCLEKIISIIDEFFDYRKRMFKNE